MNMRSISAALGRYEDTLFIVSAIALVAVVSAVLIVALVRANEEWVRFAAEHNCRVVGKSSGSVVPSTGIAIAPSGNVGVVVTTTTIPAKTGYLCDDGITYWR